MKYLALALLLCLVPLVAAEEVIQDDEDAFIFISEQGDRIENYFDEQGNVIRSVLVDAANNRFETIYNAAGDVLEENFPDEIAGVDVREPWVERGENERGVAGEVHYDGKERAVKVIDEFVFGYTGVTDYTYFDKQQGVERDGHNAYEWVVEQEVSTLVKDGETRASIVQTFDKQGNRVSRETEGLTLVIPILQMIAQFYGYDSSDIRQLEE